MTSLKTKLIIGFCGLLAILLVVGIMSIRTSNDFSKSIERILRENYDSVVACYKMKGAVERLDRLAMASIWEIPQDVHSQSEGLFHDFEKNLQFQQQNVTVLGEQVLTDRMTEEWKTYREEVESLLKPLSSKPVRLDFFRNHFLVRSDALRDTAQKIIDLNLNNMVAVDGQTRLRAIDAWQTPLFMVFSGFALAVVFISLIWPSIFRPIAGLMRSVHEIQHGNLDLVVNVH